MKALLWIAAVLGTLLAGFFVYLRYKYPPESEAEKAERQRRLASEFWRFYYFGS